METSCGCRLIEVRDPVQDVGIPVAVLYPAQGEERTERFGPYALEVARDAAPVGEGLRLVVLSHGHGGTPWGYRDLARHLALSGFVVALPEHLGNSRSDNSLAQTAANLQNRPRHVSLTIDAVLVDPVIGGQVGAGGVGVIGHSIGGYTALAVAGGLPWANPQESADGKAHPVQVRVDERVCSLVLLMPAVYWFVEEGLRGVRVPILLRSGERDEMTPVAHVEQVIGGVGAPALVEHEVIPGAGHFAVMSPFPPEMVRPEFPPSQDPDGFRRKDIQPKLFGDVVEFLERTL